MFSAEPILDLPHLVRQVACDSQLECEVLKLFRSQLAIAVERLPALQIGERRDILHRLTGSARGVGAFRLAACCAEHEGSTAALAWRDRFLAVAAQTLAAVEARLAERASSG